MNPPTNHEAIYARWARFVVPATNSLIRMLNDGTVHRTAFERMQSGLLVFNGSQRYDAMSEADLMFESIEEGADALNYLIENHARGVGNG